MNKLLNKESGNQKWSGSFLFLAGRLPQRESSLTWKLSAKQLSDTVIVEIV
ncbi:hypothetical protein [Lentibacillus juripiscarius]|uniref:Uncharacterized protein n=1 Tax=Lentibacillus juripiscarius TaxID=257446 RepID=A0ABW5V573_9BACI